MRITTAFLIVLAALVSACGTTSEPECGLYDFSCEDTPQSAPLISAPDPASPDQARTPVAASPAPSVTSGSAAASVTVSGVQRSLEARVRALEMQVDALTARLDTLARESRQR